MPSAIAVSGGAPLHALVVEDGVRPLAASIGALVTAAGICGTDAQYTAGGITSELIIQVEHASRDAVPLRALHPSIPR